MRAARHVPGHRRLRRRRHALGRHHAGASRRGDGCCDHPQDREDQEKSTEPESDHRILNLTSSFAMEGARVHVLGKGWSVAVVMPGSGRGDTSRSVAGASEAVDAERARSPRGVRCVRDRINKDRCRHEASASRIGHFGAASPEHCAAVRARMASMRFRSAIFARTSARWCSVRAFTSAQV